MLLNAKFAAALVLLAVAMSASSQPTPSAAGAKAKTGRLEAGKWADIIAVEENPLDDVLIIK